MQHAAIWSSVVALTLTVLAAPAGAHDVIEQHDEDVLFVGHPLAGSIGPQVDGDDGGQGLEVTSSIVYAFHVHDPAHQVDLEVVYDPGPVIHPAMCLRVTDLDLVLEGPDGVVRELDGCDQGRLEIHEQGLAPGDYTVTVYAEHGTTVCLPDLDPDDVDCSTPRVRYTYDLRVWDPRL